MIFVVCIIIYYRGIISMCVYTCVCVCVPLFSHSTHELLAWGARAHLDQGNISQVDIVSYSAHRTCNISALSSATDLLCKLSSVEAV